MFNKILFAFLLLKLVSSHCSDSFEEQKTTSLPLFQLKSTYQEELNPGLYLNLERVTPQNIEDWQAYGYDSTLAFKIIEDDSILRISKQGLVINGLKDARSMFYSHLIYYDLEKISVWVCYAANTSTIDISNKDHYKHVEMALTITSFHGSPYVKHMGIMRNPGYDKDLLPHKNLSLILHAFAAQCLSNDPEKEIMYSFPLKSMRCILAENLEKGEYYMAKVATNVFEEEYEKIEKFFKEGPHHDKNGEEFFVKTTGRSYVANLFFMPLSILAGKLHDF